MSQATVWTSTRPQPVSVLLPEPV